MSNPTCCPPISTILSHNRGFIHGIPYMHIYLTCSLSVFSQVCQKMAVTKQVLVCVGMSNGIVSLCSCSSGGGG